jgi:hypothetical protein
MNIATESTAHQHRRGVAWDLGGLVSPGTKTAGAEKIPVIHPLASPIAPKQLEVFTRWNSASSGEGIVLHFFTDDDSQRFAVVNPLKWVGRLSNAAAVISPDLSLYAEYPQCIRRVHTIMNRTAGAVWQQRGLNVITNVRWNDPADFDYCFDGVPPRSQVAVSSVTMLRNRANRMNLVRGFETMLDRLQPSSVIWHGGIPREMPISVWNSVEVLVYPSQTARAFEKGANNGRG